MKIVEYIVYIFVICIALNNPSTSNKFFIIGPIIVTIYFSIMKLKKNIFNKNLLKSVVFLLIFNTIYGGLLLYYNLYSLNSILVQVTLPLSLFIMGYLVMIKKDSNQFVNILISISFSSCVYVFLCLALTIKRYGFGNYEHGRVVFDIWNKNNIINVTNMTAFLAIAICVIGVLVARNNKKSKRLICIATLELIVATSFIIFTGGRTAMMLIPFTLILTYIIVPNKFSKKIKYLLGIVIIVFLGIYIYNFNIFNIKEIIQSSTLWQRLNTESIVHDVRFNTWNEIIKGIIYHPFGGKQIQISLNYAHNIFLDTIYYGGVQSCIFLVLFMIQYSYKAIIIILKDSNKTLCAILSAFSISSLLYFSFEPALQGSLNMFSIFAFVFGMISSYFYKLKNECENNLSKNSNL